MKKITTKIQFSILKIPNYIIRQQYQAQRTQRTNDRSSSQCLINKFVTINLITSQACRSSDFAQLGFILPVLLTYTTVLNGNLLWRQYSHRPFLLFLILFPLYSSFFSSHFGFILGRTFYQNCKPIAVPLSSPPFSYFFLPFCFRLLL